MEADENPIPFTSKLFASVTEILLDI